jgi:hypothetical protein
VGAITVDATNGNAINYEHLIASMKGNHIEFYEIAPGATAELRQYFRVDDGNTTNGAIVADLRPEAVVTFTEGAYVVPLDQLANSIAVSLFEPDNSHGNGFNAAVTQTLSGAEGLALVLHDFATRDYPYYRYEGNNPRDFFKSPAKECDHVECVKGICEKIKDIGTIIRECDHHDCEADFCKKIDNTIDKILDKAGCNAGYGLAFILLVPFFFRKVK